MLAFPTALALPYHYCHAVQEEELFTAIHAVSVPSRVYAALHCLLRDNRFFDSSTPAAKGGYAVMRVQAEQGYGMFHLTDTLSDLF